jgi:hypothetical protein
MEHSQTLDEEQTKYLLKFLDSWKNKGEAFIKRGMLTMLQKGVEWRRVVQLFNRNIMPVFPAYKHLLEDVTPQAQTDIPCGFDTAPVIAARQKQPPQNSTSHNIPITPQAQTDIPCGFDTAPVIAARQKQLPQNPTSHNIPIHDRVYPDRARSIKRDPDTVHGLLTASIILGRTKPNLNTHGFEFIENPNLPQTINPKALALDFGQNAFLGIKAPLPNGPHPNTAQPNIISGSNTGPVLTAHQQRPLHNPQGNFHQRTSEAQRSAGPNEAPSPFINLRGIGKPRVSNMIDFTSLLLDAGKPKTSTTQFMVPNQQSPLLRSVKNDLATDRLEQMLPHQQLSQSSSISSKLSPPPPGQPSTNLNLGYRGLLKMRRDSSKSSSSSSSSSTSSSKSNSNSAKVDHNLHDDVTLVHKPAFVDKEPSDSSLDENKNDNDDNDNGGNNSDNGAHHACEDNAHSILQPAKAADIKNDKTRSEDQQQDNVTRLVKKPWAPSMAENNGNSESDDNPLMITTMHPRRNRRIFKRNRIESSSDDEPITTTFRYNMEDIDPKKWKDRCGRLPRIHNKGKGKQMTNAGGTIRKPKTSSDEEGIDDQSDNEP